MKCPKCGYHSFDHLDSCKKCGQGLADHKAKFNLRGFFFPGHTATAEPSPLAENSFGQEEASEAGSVDLGFDFLDENGDKEAQFDSTEEISLGDGGYMVSIKQPFGADSEMIPADEQHSSDKEKTGKGPEFAF
jgi:hypothetical protein